MQMLPNARPIGYHRIFVMTMVVGFLLCIFVPHIVLGAEIEVLPSVESTDNLVVYTPGYGLMSDNQHLFVSSVNWADFSSLSADTIRYTPGYGLMSDNQHLFVSSVNWADYPNE